MLMEEITTDGKAQKTAVKLFVSQRLHSLQINRVALSDLIGKSLSYMSQVEGGTSNFPDELISTYRDALKLNPDENNRFSDLVRLQNARRSVKNQTPRVKELSALLDANGASLPIQTLDEIESLIKSALSKRNVSFYKRGPSNGSSGKSPNRMTPQRFLEINAKLAAFRKDAVGESRGYFCVNEMVEFADAFCNDFQISWCEKLPKKFGQAYACVETTDGFSTLHVSEILYRQAQSNSSFPRHLMAHELSHYVLGHDGMRLLAPTMIGSQKSTKLADSDPAEELEANIGAVLLLIDWKSLFKVQPVNRAILFKSYRLDEESATSAFFMMQNPLVKKHLDQKA